MSFRQQPTNRKKGFSMSIDNLSKASDLIDRIRRITADKYNNPCHTDWVMYQNLFKQNNQAPYQLYTVDNSLLIEVYLAGFSRENVDVSYDGEKVNVVASRTNPKGEAVTKNFVYNTRMQPMATFNNGLLTLKFAAEPPTVTKIPLS